MDLIEKTKKLWMRTRERYFHGQSRVIDSRSQNLIGRSSSWEASNKEKSGESLVIDNTLEDVENPDPERIRFKKPKRIGKITRWFRQTKKFWRPELTPAEAEMLAQKKRNKSIDRSMKQSMRNLNSKLVNAYTRLGIEYFSQNRSKHERGKFTEVWFDCWGYTDGGATAIGHVGKVPYGFSATKLVDDNVLSDLSIAAEHPVRGTCSPEAGVLIRVSLAGTLDIPDLIAFSEAKTWISTSLPPLAFFVGIGENGAKKYFNLEEAPHLLIGGATGSGKSIAMLAILATIVDRNSPETVRLVLADLKRVELVEFEGIPHLITEIPGIPTGIATEAVQIIPMLRWLERENDRRQSLFAKDHIHNLAEWNRRNRLHRMPRILIAIDEIARLQRDKKTNKEFLELTYDLASTARATGLYMIISTQFAKDKYVSTDIKLNFNARLCFSVPDLAGSICMVETGEATNLYPPPGRAIFVHGVNRYKVQAPFITSAQIALIVKSAKAGKTMTDLSVDEFVSPEEICSWALNSNNGFMQNRETFKEFAARMTWPETVKQLSEMDNQIFVIGENTYRIISPSGTRGRKLEIINPGDLPEMSLEAIANKSEMISPDRDDRPDRKIE